MSHIQGTTSRRASLSQESPYQEEGGGGEEIGAMQEGDFFSNVGLKSGDGENVCNVTQKWEREGDIRCTKKGGGGNVNVTR